MKISCSTSLTGRLALVLGKNSVIKNKRGCYEETHEGLRITGMLMHRCINLTCLIINFQPSLSLVPGVKCFLSCHICQDPIEKFFGCQRQCGGTHSNLTVQPTLFPTSCVKTILLRQPLFTLSCASQLC